MGKALRGRRSPLGEQDRDTGWIWRVWRDKKWERRDNGGFRELERPRRMKVPLGYFEFRTGGEE